MTEAVTPGSATNFDGYGQALPLAELRAEAERLIAGTPHRVSRVRLRAGDNVVEIDWDVPGSGPASGVVEAEPEPGTVPAGRPVVSPLVGVFYRAPGSGQAPFVEVGDEVVIGQQLGIVEAMKLMNPIVAETAGRVIAVSGLDGEMVEYDQVLFELISDPVGG